MWLDLARGVSFLLALCFLHAFIVRRWNQDEPIGRLLSGLLFGVVCVIAMFAPIEVAPGHIADARSVVLAAAGLFGGVVAGGIAAVIAGGFRFWLGGGGAPVGVVAIFVCVLLGLAYRHGHQRGWWSISFLPLLLFGLIVHLVVVYLFTFLPKEVARMVMQNVAVPFVLAFTPATALLGMMLHWINQQVRTEIALARSERRFKDIAENSSDWIWEMGPDLRFTYFSNRAGAAIGYDLTQRIGLKREEALPRFELDEYAEKWASHFADLKARRPFRNFEYILDGGPDGLRYIRINGSPVFAPDGAFLGYHGSGSDITAEKTAQVALRESEEHYRDLFDGLEVGIHVGTGEKGCVFANPACAHLFGYEGVDALKTVTPENLITAHDRDRVSQHERDLYAGRCTSVQYEVDGQNRDGSHKPLQVFARRILWDGETAIMRTFIDLTDRKRAEEQLRQAQKMEAVGQLTGGVAHDFNNILTAVTANLELATRSVDQDSTVARLIRRAAAATWRAARLTDRLLAFSRAHAMNPQVVSATDLVEEMTDLLHRTVTETITIECNSPDDPWMCEVDPNQLESAILNLTINARDAMPDGGMLTIDIRNADLRADAAAARARVAPGEYVVVAVTDTGTGMSPGTAEKAFEPFFTSKDVGKGSGLGLSMVYGFVTQSGGHVTIDSEVGKGTTVSLYLPRSDARAPQVSPDAEPTDLAEARGETVLIVEDDEDVRAISVDLLSGLGYTVLEAIDGQSAILLAESTPHIDLLFTDIVLPGGMKGPELASKIANIHAEIEILYTSGYTKSEVFHHEIDDKSFEMIKKPFSIDDLAKRVRSILDRAHE